MWGAIAAGIGSVVGGVTNLVAASSQGTAMCGARPTCLFGKTCREKKENFEGNHKKKKKISYGYF
jgi:hypothetical protein